LLPLSDLLFVVPVVVVVVVAAAAGDTVVGSVLVAAAACCRDLALASSSSCTGSRTRCKASVIKLKNVQYTYNLILLSEKYISLPTIRNILLVCCRYQELKTVMVIRMPLKN
jgi:hypothetical protein